MKGHGWGSEDAHGGLGPASARASASASASGWVDGWVVGGLLGDVATQWLLKADELQQQMPSHYRHYHLMCSRYYRLTLVVASTTSAGQKWHQQVFLKNMFPDRIVDF